MQSQIAHHTQFNQTLNQFFLPCSLQHSTKVDMLSDRHSGINNLEPDLLVENELCIARKGIKHSSI